MKKIYKYKNATIEIFMSYNNDLNTIQNATEKFLKKVIKERIQNGDNYTSRNIRKEQVLDK